MASRRVRIKGIANIPQRRKLGNGSEEEKKDGTKLEAENLHNLDGNVLSHVGDNNTVRINNNANELRTTGASKFSDEIIIHDSNSLAQSSINLPSSNKPPHLTATITLPAANVDNTIVKDSSGKDSSQEQNSVLVNSFAAVSTDTIERDCDDVTAKVSSKSIAKATLEQESEINNASENEIFEKANCNVKDVVSNNDTSKPVSVRRRFLKPTISSNAISRKLKDKIEETKADQDKENVDETVNINLSETVISVNSTNISPLIQKIDSSLGPQTAKTGASRFQKYSKDSSAKSGSDTEYPPPPASPNKLLNRTRIKAVPRLDKRRTSFSIGSASESEDDTRRSYSRIRNDSVCSVASGINETQPATEAVSPVRKEFISVIQRKCRRTEQSRKLAEARREFQMKFNNGTPDKQKLTMIDLIFYNPTSNPMSQKKKRKLSERKEDVEHTPNELPHDEDVSDTLEKEKLEEERADDLLAASDNDDDILAPQIKIGANGEIVVDEKSLVIENVETKKGREALQNSELVDGDFDTNYGVYKRVKRSKDWSREETLRFYKALNTIGTDFTMMCELFPQRTRRELKMKFKKEERMNTGLIDKAVMQPVEFDLTELRRDLEMEERKQEEMKRRKKEKSDLKEQAIKSNVKRKRLDIRGVHSIAEQNNDVHMKKVPRKKKKKTNSAYDAVKSGINGLLDDSEDDLPDTYNRKDDSEESALEKNRKNKLAVRKTRFGRISKSKASNGKAAKDEILSTEVEKSNSNQSAGMDESTNSDLEPGSIMIVTSKMSSGEMVYKVFMVTDGQNKQQINLEPDVLKNLTQRVQLNNVSAQNILTISAHEHPENSTHKSVKTLPTTVIDSITNIEDDDNIPVEQQSLPDDCSEITSDSIIFPFDECVKASPAKQNITISHDESKLIIVTEDSNSSSSN